MAADRAGNRARVLYARRVFADTAGRENRPAAGADAGALRRHAARRRGGGGLWLRRPLDVGPSARSRRRSALASARGVDRPRGARRGDAAGDARAARPEREQPAARRPRQHGRHAPGDLGRPLDARPRRGRSSAPALRRRAGGTGARDRGGSGAGPARRRGEPGDEAAVGGRRVELGRHVLPPGPPERLSPAGAAAADHRGRLRAAHGSDRRTPRGRLQHPGRPSAPRRAGEDRARRARRGGPRSRPLHRVCIQRAARFLPEARLVGARLARAPGRGPPHPADRAAVRPGADPRGGAPAQARPAEPMHRHRWRRQL